LIIKLQGAFGIKEDYIRECLLMARNNIEGGQINNEIYTSICRAIAAYKAIDIMNKEEVFKCNYYLIIWLFDGEEPDDYKVKIGVDQLDTDKSKNISLNEWLMFLCLYDDKADVNFFKGELRKIFYRADSDHSGVLEKNEASQLIAETLNIWAKNLTQSTEDEQFSKGL